MLRYAFEKSTEYERFVLVKLAEATIKVMLRPGPMIQCSFALSKAASIGPRADWLVASTLAKETLRAF